MAANEDIERIRGRIRALLQKTVENGATEAEAMSAAEKARAMMDQHQINVTAAQIETEEVDVQTSDIFEKRRDRVWSVAAAVSRFTDTKAWGKGRLVNFMGVGGDAEFALYLFESLVRTRDNELNAWRGSVDYKMEIANGHNANAMRTEFTDAFVSRVSERLKSLKDADKGEAATHSRALVPVKDGVIRRELARRGMRFRAASTSATSGNSAAAREAGRAAGNRANFGRPVGGAGGGGKRLISGR